jgi:hypothetical protein
MSQSPSSSPEQRHSKHPAGPVGDGSNLHSPLQPLFLSGKQLTPPPHTDISVILWAQIHKSLYRNRRTSYNSST